MTIELTPAPPAQGASVRSGASLPGAIDRLIIGMKPGIQLQPAPIDPSWIIAGDPVASNAFLNRSDDRLETILVWECTVGSFHWYYDVDETIILLRGSIVVESDTMPPTRFGAGDVILFKKGAHARWRIDEPVRKIALLRDPQPLPLALAGKAWSRLVRMIKGGPKGGH